jgi:hypothetical protein
MFIGFVLVDLIAQRLEARRAAVSAPAGLPWNIPQGFYLSEGHTWSYRIAQWGRGWVQTRWSLMLWALWKRSPAKGRGTGEIR